MPGRASVSEIAEVLAKTYRAIDVRVAAVRDGDGWVSGGGCAGPAREAQLSFNLTGGCEQTVVDHWSLGKRGD